MNRIYLLTLIVLCLGLLVVKSIKAESIHRLSAINATKKITTTPITISLAETPPNKTKTKLKGKGPSKNVKIVVPKKNIGTQKMLTVETVRQWAQKISTQLHEIERHVTRQDILLKAFSDVKYETRSGASIVDEMADKLKELLMRRTEAAKDIMRAAEYLSKNRNSMPYNFQFDNSVNLDALKPKLEKPEQYVYQTTCENFGKVKLQQSKHFGDAQVSLDYSSVQVSPEVFSCDDDVLKNIYASEKLISTFRENYAKDATLDFQYFCSAKGFLRHYPAANWDSMFKIKISEENSVYDCRLRPWYVSAGGAPRDILILLDASGSMYNSSNKVTAEVFTKTLLNVLTDDDQVNVLRFNVVIESPISCFNEMLVPASQVNAAAMIAAMKNQKMKNETKMEAVLEYAVRMLQRQRNDKTRQVPCQQAIVLLTDSLYGNFSELMNILDPENTIRLFIFWLHDPNGLRDHTREFGEGLSCERDGYFAELITTYDVTEQVMKILRVLERPLVLQKKERFEVFSDVIAHVEDPRRGEYWWMQKEKDEQVHRYNELRINRDGLLNSSRLLEDFMYQESLDKKGQYYEGEDINYRLQISVAVPVFDYTTSENITRTIRNKKTQISLRTYPVNRLLGVAGVDIPIDHLKLILPYDELGGGGILFLIDHRGNIVIHDNLKPSFDGDILKPGYRTVDMVDIEQPAADHPPRHYPREWLEFRSDVIINEKRGNRTVYGKNVYEGGMRMLLEKREYHWRRILDHYTAVVVLPTYNRRHATYDGVFTQKLAEEAFKSLSDYPEFSIQPDWLYCRHVDPSFDSPQRELQHFLRRRRDEANFPMKHLNHYFSPIEPTLLEKTYQCNEQLMASVSKEAVASAAWAKDQEEHAKEVCTKCQLGSVTSFFASENGLTRWQRYFTIGSVDPPDGNDWPKGPLESWYKRAVATPDTLVIHAPVRPVQRFRNTFKPPPPLTTRWLWLTAARVLGHANKGTIGVTGFHFYPPNLEALLDITTHQPSCEEDDEDDECDQQCDGEDWSCLLVDEAGWVLAGGGKSIEDPPQLRQHLATLHPLAMSVLLNASVFKLHWLHDYQAICFPYDNEPSTAAAPTLTSLLQSIYTSVNYITTVLRSISSLLTLMYSVNPVNSDTQAEKDKRRRRLKKDFEREKYESLYDDRVLVNRTSFAACDRSRPLYEFQRSFQSMEALKRAPHACNWPLVGSVVPGTNLLLLAVYNLCPYFGRPVPDPMNNEPVDMTDESFVYKDAASRLACWRNRVPLPGRPPHTPCYPHDYSQRALASHSIITYKTNDKLVNHRNARTLEGLLLNLLTLWHCAYYIINIGCPKEENGYRQCGPWEYHYIEDEDE